MNRRIVIDETKLRIAKLFVLSVLERADVSENIHASRFSVQAYRKALNAKSIHQIFNNLLVLQGGHQHNYAHFAWATTAREN